MRRFFPRESLFRSVRANVFMSVVFLLIIPFCLTFIYTNRPLENSIKQKIGESNQNALSILSGNVDKLFVEVMKSAVGISQDPATLEVLENSDSFTEYNKLLFISEVINKLYSPYINESYAALLDLKGHLYASWYAEPGTYAAFQQSGWLESLLVSDKEFVWLSETRNYTFADKRPLVSLAVKVHDYKLNQDIGVVLFSIVEGDIRKLLNELDGNVRVVNESDIVLSDKNVENVGKNISSEPYMEQLKRSKQGQITDRVDNQKSIVFYQTLHNNDWKIIRNIPYDTIFKQIFDLRKANFYIVLAIFTLFCLITLLLSHHITKPLNSLNKKIREMEQSEFKSELVVQGPLEISNLIRTYNHMLGQIRELLLRLKNEYKQKEELRFKALQSQINPHFLLNTLNNIKWMAYIREDYEVGEMLSSLGAIMESSIGRKGGFITLREEIEYIDHYIILQKMKYNEKLSISYTIPEDLLKCEIIKFILQPLVENSIYHGIDQMKGKGAIHITAARSKQSLKLTVADNGVGMNQRKLNQLRHALSSQDDALSNERIGMRNVQERIRSQYGNEYGIDVDSSENKGTSVKLIFPLKVADTTGKDG